MALLYVLLGQGVQRQVESTASTQCFRVHLSVDQAVLEAVQRIR